MPVVKKVEVDVSVKGVEDAKVKISEVKVAADNLKRDNPKIVVDIDKQKALLEARLLRAGLKAEFDKAIEQKVRVDAAGTDPFGVKGLGFLKGLTGSLPGGASTALSGVPFLGNLAGGNPYVVGGAIAAATVAAGALLTEVAGLVAGFAAATAGVGAFAVLAIPTFKQITQDVGQLQTAQENLQKAQNLEKLFPSPAHLKAVQTAEQNLSAVQRGMGQDAGSAASGIEKLRKEYDKITAAFQPSVMKIFNDGLKIANDLLPKVTPLATAFTKALDPLLNRLDKFVNSKGFQDWLNKFTALIGPATTAIGNGIGHVATNFGKLLTQLSKKDVVNAINIAFTILSGTIRGISVSIKIAMAAWDFFYKAVIIQLGWVLKAATLALGWNPLFGPQLRRASAEFAVFEAGILSGLGNIQKAAQTTAASLAAAGYAATHAFAKGPSSPTGIGGAPPHAAGGWASGWSLVGEQGPELIYTPGSQVYNNSQTTNMLSGGMSSSQAERLIGRLDILIAAQYQGNAIGSGQGSDFAATLNNSARAAAYRTLYNPRAV